MNNVHLVTQEEKTSQNGSKIGRVHRVHSLTPARAPRPSACCARPARPAHHCLPRPRPSAPRAYLSRAPVSCRSQRAPCAPNRLPCARPACAPSRLPLARPAPSACQPSTLHAQHLRPSPAPCRGYSGCIVA